MAKSSKSSSEAESLSSQTTQGKEHLKDHLFKHVAKLKEKLKGLGFKGLAKHKDRGGRYFKNQEANSAVIIRLTKEKANLQAKNKRLKEDLQSERNRTDSVVKVLTACEDQKLRMFESYSGVVEEVEGGTVVVRYEVNGDIVDQTYDKSQFQEERLPVVGDCLVVHVFVTESPRKAVDQETIDKARAENEQPNPDRTPITGP